MKKLFERLHKDNPFHEGVNVRNLTHFSGRGGMPLLQGDLYINDTKVAFISEDCRGGSLNIDIFDKNGFVNILSQTLKTDNIDNPNVEEYFTDILYVADFIREAKKFEKTKTIFLIPNIYQQVNVDIPYDKNLKKALKEKFGKDIVIFNEYI